MAPSRVNLKRALLVLLAFILSAAEPLHAAGPGTSAATFLNLGFGARPLALGEAFVAMADDVSALHYNPAGLAYPGSLASRQQPREYEMLASHSVHIQQIRLSQMGLIKRPWGVSLTHLGMGGIERRTTETAASEGSFGASDLMMGVSYGRSLNGIGVGGTVKLVRQSIGEYSATAYAADFGALYRVPGRPVSLGASLTNLGAPVKFVNRAYPLPRTLRLAMTYGMTKRFPHALSLQLDFPRDNAPVVRLGMEYLGFGPFALRAGYRTASSTQRTAALGKTLGSTAGGISEFYGIFMGVGFRSALGSLDYTLLPYGELGSAHRLSFTLRFGKSQQTGTIGVFQ